MSPALRELIALLAEIAVEDFLREREQDKSKQREPKGSNAEEARVRLDRQHNTRS